MTRVAEAVTALFVPGDRPDRYGKAAASGADVVIVDLEDAVAAPDKDAARDAVASALRPEPNRRGVSALRALVRINDPESRPGTADLAMVVALAREPGHGLSEKRLLRRLVEMQPGDSRFLAGGDAPGVRPVIVGLRALASLEFDDLHQLLNERRGQLRRGSRVNEFHQMPYMSGGGPHSEPGRGGIAAPTHVRDHSLGSQHLVQMGGVCPRDCFEHCICPSGQLDAQGPRIDASG